MTQSVDSICLRWRVIHQSSVNKPKYGVEQFTRPSSLNKGPLHSRWPSKSESLIYSSSLFCLRDVAHRSRRRKFITGTNAAPSSGPIVERLHFRLLRQALQGHLMFKCNSPQPLQRWRIDPITLEIDWVKVSRPNHQNRSFRRLASKPISWLSSEKLKQR